MRVVDLSFPIRPHFRWTVRPELRSSHARGDIFQSTMLTISCHACTHVDAPVHFLPGDRHIGEMLVDQWKGAAAVGYDYPPDYCIRTSIFSPDTPRTRADCPRTTSSSPRGSP
jgi:kynurenine formamidase